MTGQPAQRDVNWEQAAGASAVGFLLGGAVLAAAWVATLRAQGLPDDVSGLVAIHANNPAMWLLDLLPTAGGVFGALLTRLLGDTAALAARNQQLQADLREDALSHQLVSHLIDGVVVVDPRGRVLSINPAAEALFGYDSQSAVGLPIADLIPEHTLAATDRSVMRTTSKAVELGVEWHVDGRHADGSTFPLELTWFEGDGHAAGRFVYVVRDPQGTAGRLRRTNALLRGARDRAVAEARNKDRFVARVAQDLRTPLTSLLGYAEVLLEDAEELGAEAARPDLERIRRAGLHILAVITNTLELVEVEAELERGSVEDIDVPELVDGIERAMRRRARRFNNRLLVDVADDARTVRADPFLVRRILFKLVDNACKHTREGRIRVEVSRHDGASGPMIRFYVADTGPGLSARYAERVFDEGARSAHLPDEGARRLTLPLARRLARRMHGELSLRSAPKEGTVFLLELPEREPELTGAASP